MWFDWLIYGLGSVGNQVEQPTGQPVVFIVLSNATKLKALRGSPSRESLVQSLELPVSTHIYAIPCISVDYQRNDPS
jgi:hypothetical protein